MNTDLINSIQTPAGDSSVPIGIAAWLACMVAALWIGLLIVKVVKEIRGKPSAGEVQSEVAERFVTKHQCEKGHLLINETFRDIFSKMGGVERGAQASLGMEVQTLRKERTDDAHILQVRLSKFEEQIGGLKVATDLQTGQLKRIDEKLDNLILKS